MKKIFILGLILSSFVGSAATFTWLGTTSSSYTVAANWFSLGGGIPGPGDDIQFVGLNSNDCIVPASHQMDVNSITLGLGYNAIFNMGSADHGIVSALTINAGTVISTTGTIFMGGNANFSLASGALFTNSNGTISIAPGSGNTFTFSGDIILKTLVLNFPSGTNTLRNVDFGSNLTVDNIIFLTPSTRIFAFQGTVHVKSTLNIGGASHTTTSTANTGTFIFDGSGANIIGTSAGAGTAYLANITMSVSGVGTYSMSGDINLTGNWNAGTAGNIVSGSSIVNLYGSSSSITGAAAFDNLTLQSGSGVTFPTGVEILINKNFSVISGANPTFQAGGALGFNGISQNISGTFSPQIINIKAGSATTLLNPVTLIDALTVDGSLVSNGNLTLHADGSGSARVGTSLGTITGNVTVETFLRGGNTDWANLGIRGVQNQPISSWDSGSGAATGIPMTCYGCIYQPSDAGDFMSIQGWDETIDYYDTLAANINSSTILTPGKGFWVYVGSASGGTGDLKLVNTGALVQGQVVFPVTAAGAGAGGVFYNLVANPYPSPISWMSVLANNGSASFSFNDAIYAYSAEQGDVSYVNGTGTNFDENIPGGQGFYVEYLNNGPSSITFEETDKSSTTFDIAKPNPTYYGQIFKLKLSGALDNDETVFRMHEDATNFYDKKWDAHKMFQTPGYLGYPGSYTKFTSISSKDAIGDDYSIHSVPLLYENRTIPLLVRVSTSGTYTIQAHDFKDYDGCVGLRDNLTNTFHDLKQSDYVFIISDTTSTPRFDLVLCRDESLTTGMPTQQSSSSILINQDQQGAFVKTAFSRNTKATISAFNLMGQKIMEDVNVEGTGTNTRLNIDMQNQIVIIRVVTDKESSTKKIVMH